MIKGSSDAQNPSKVPFYLYKFLFARTHPKPNSYTIAFVLKACSIASAFEEGRQVHSHALISGLLFSSPFVQTALLNFYGKCGEIGFAQQVFNEMSERNLVSWSTMVSGYVRNGLVNEAFCLFGEMQKLDIVPDEVTMVSLVSACAMSGALDIGGWVHAYVSKLGIRADIELGTALVNMYAKCGSIEKAKEVFDAMPVKDTKAWSSMIVGLAIHGLAGEALKAFSKMQETKVRPNHVTFLGVLSACAHGGLVSEGQKHWSAMLECGIEPSMELYGCMVNLFCRANLIEEAHKFTENMPIIPNPIIWRTLLMGCKRSKTLMGKAETFVERLLELEPLNDGNYILVCNLYASQSRWEKVKEVRKKMKERNIDVIMPGKSSIEIDGFVYEFVMGDWSHPEARAIREAVREMCEKVAAAGHKPDISSVLHDMVEEEKEKALLEHSERLAIALGLIKIKAPAVIRVVKNLRVCEDCHEVTKLVSRLYEREIIVRDRVRFHRFVNGACSCLDYW
ncbi:hypothetical protein Nepgr_021990 [Nepenthes gracilis]|uniref:DYW domain-containing protein n=1 Tax=Nepenthes gracilis TaxID=150966 RepID=A0AAD3T019_NEPGR|nr:hypothetical protein Nepgr_021990 [Nepenthes gracilis]